MSLRDQLMKSGLASKEQAKKAQREASRQQHKKLQHSRDPKAVAEVSVAEQTLAAKREADKRLNLKRNEERLAKEADARAIDIVASHNLIDGHGSERYYFVVDGKRIACLRVTEEQILLLETGALAIVSRDHENFALVSEENADKIRMGSTYAIVCQHRSETTKF